MYQTVQLLDFEYIQGKTLWSEGIFLCRLNTYQSIIKPFSKSDCSLCNMFCFFFGSPGICTPCTLSTCIWIHIYCTLVYRVFSGLLSSVEVFEDASFYPGKRGWGGGWGGALGSCKSQGSNNIAQITWQSSGWGWERRWGLRKIWTPSLVLIIFQKTNCVLCNHIFLCVW